jgi:hypothetical protein
MVAVTGLYKSKLSKIKESMLRISERSASLRYDTTLFYTKRNLPPQVEKKADVIERIISIGHFVFVRRRMKTVGWGEGEAGMLGLG